MASLFESLKHFYATLDHEPSCWIAYSGGMDSHVLLHASARIRDIFPIRLHAIHVNHGLSQQANAWADHCEKICCELKIPFSVFTLQIQVKKNASLEEIARNQRYAVFSECLTVGDYLFTAHHRDDQAETVMLQLLRGAGSKGLAAMPEKKKLGAGTQMRPFLSVDQSMIRAYAKQYGLQWIEDESNTNRDFSRNFLRHDVFPLLKKQWPGMTKSLARVARHAATTQNLLSNIIEKHFQQMYEPTDGTLCQSLLCQLLPDMQSEVLRYWIQHQKFPLPSSVKVQTILTCFLTAKSDKNPLVSWGNVTLRRYQHRLYLLPQWAEHDTEQTFFWDLQQSLKIATVGTLIATPTKDRGFAMDLTVEVRFRQGGERCQLPGRQGRHSLKNLFQYWKVPPWLRDRIPLLYVDDTLAAVVGYYFNEAFHVASHETGYHVALAD